MKKLFTLKNSVIFLGLFLIFFILIQFNTFSSMRNTFSDNLHGGENVLDNIIIIKIDDPSINEIGRWPWERDVFVEILKKVQKAKVVGIDVSFFEKSDTDEQLKEQIENMNNVVLAAELNDEILYKPIFNTNYGYVNLFTNNDGITRGVNSKLTTESLPFAFQIYQQGLNQNAIFEKESYLIHFADKPNTFDSVSVVELLNSNDEKYNFDNKIVLIGATAPDLHDNYFVPTSKGIAMNGVEIHANILQNLILNNFITKQGKFSLIIFVLVISFLCMFFLSRIKIYYSIPIIIGFLIVHALISILLFNGFNYILDIFFPFLAGIIFTGTGTGIHYLEEKKLNAHLTNAFGKYISKDLLKHIIERKHELKLGGAKRTITIFFSDIRGFTSISEKLTPEKLVHLLNEYFTEMGNIILKHQGTVDKFIGDAIMAFWNAPLEEKKHVQLACLASIEQIKKLKKMQTQWKKDNLPIIQIGVGVHTGEAIIGNMGSEDRFDYTAMGDTINLGSRLEGLTKQYGVDIIASEETYKIVKKEFKFRKLDAVKVKGKKIPVVIYELCINYDKDFTVAYEKALELYFKSKFKEALEQFEIALRLKEKDVSCELFIDRCKEYLQDPPAKDWDGAFVMKSK